MAKRAISTLMIRFASETFKSGAAIFFEELMTPEENKKDMTL
jgi:hypothetical protein